MIGYIHIAAIQIIYLSVGLRAMSCAGDTLSLPSGVLASDKERPVNTGTQVV